MTQESAKSGSRFPFNFRHIFKRLRYRQIVIFLAGILAGILGFFYTRYIAVPQYTSSVPLYVSALSGDGSTFELTFDTSLARLNTYVEILKTPTAIERIIQQTGEGYSYQQVMDMISALPREDIVGIELTVICDTAAEAAKLIDIAAEVLCNRVSEIDPRVSLTPLGAAALPQQAFSMHIAASTLLFAIGGMLLAVFCFICIFTLDNTIRNEEDLMEVCNIPILAKVPHLPDRIFASGAQRDI